MGEIVLSIWTVYDNPRDMPGLFVARRFDVLRGQPEPVATSHVLTGSTLDDVRVQLPPGLHRQGRQLGDERQIVEVWF